MSKRSRKHSYKQAVPFSQTLENWLRPGKDTTLGGLVDAFAEKSFAIIFLLMMALPALPLPTGGVTHVTEAITMLVCLELISGRKTVWLPRRWLKLPIGKYISTKAAARLTGIIKWFEHYSRRRMSGLLASKPMLSIVGLIVLVFTIAAFVSPPFSGLDTLPALGVVTISLALILEDMLIVAAGIIIGAAGIALELAAGAALYSGVLHFFK